MLPEFSRQSNYFGTSQAEILTNVLNGVYPIRINHQTYKICKEEENKAFKRNYRRRNKLFPEQFKED
jgi:hypothetical protein